MECDRDSTVGKVEKMALKMIKNWGKIRVESEIRELK
jgi:hypothetical protein